MNRTGFTKYLEGKDFSVNTINSYMAQLEGFFKWMAKEDIQITKPDILSYLEHLKNSRKIQNITRQKYLIVVNHYFTFLCQSEQISQNPCALLKIRGTKQKQLHKIYSPEELDTLFDNYYLLLVRNYENNQPRYEQLRQNSILQRERNAVILSILVNQGTMTGEINKIELQDLDLIKATLTIRGGRLGNQRVLPLKATQMGLFMHYVQNIRPKLLEHHTAETNKLFVSLPAVGKRTTTNNELMSVFKPLVKQIKSIDRQFLNFKQVRASLITYWIKAQGLRKAQYLAGHRNIFCTQRYATNDLDGLINDISKAHPY